MSPQPKGRRDIAFGADPVGVHVVSVLSALLSPEPMGGFWPNLYRNIIGRGKKSDQIWVTLTLFSRSHQHFELSRFDQKSLAAPYLLNQMTDSDQTPYIVIFGWFKDLIRFSWPWPNFQGKHAIKTVKMSLVCTLSPEPNSGFRPNLHTYTIGTWERND